MDYLKSSNILVNTLLFPGSLIHSSYDPLNYAHDHQDSHLIYIPYGHGNFIPAILVLAERNIGALFCIHFHGNACDIGQIVKCAVRESHNFHAHYLIVEYPRYGIMKGMPSEMSIDHIAKIVHQHVTDKMKVNPSRIVLIGRSIGSGPTCSLASYLERQNKRPAAVILQSPFCSINDASNDLLGKSVGIFMLNRWENWRNLCGSGNDKGLVDVIKCPVLLIHADCDQVIDYHHSVMLNEARQLAGFPCELFTQVSSVRVTKGHNQYDFNHDYIIPTKSFLKKNVPLATSMQDPITLSLEQLKSLTVVPPAFFKPPPRRKCNMTSSCLWCMCPIAFCCECSVSLSCVCFNMILDSTCNKEKTYKQSFQYTSKRQRMTNNSSTATTALGVRSSVDPSAHQLYLQQQQQQRQLSLEKTAAEGMRRSKESKEDFQSFLQAVKQSPRDRVASVTAAKTSHNHYTTSSAATTTTTNNNNTTSVFHHGEAASYGSSDKAVGVNKGIQLNNYEGSLNHNNQISHNHTPNAAVSSVRVLDFVFNKNRMAELLALTAVVCVDNPVLIARMRKIRALQQQEIEMLSMKSQAQVKAQQLQQQQSQQGLSTIRSFNDAPNSARSNNSNNSDVSSNTNSNSNTGVGISSAASTATAVVAAFRFNKPSNTTAVTGDTTASPTSAGSELGNKEVRKRGSYRIPDAINSHTKRILSAFGGNSAPSTTTAAMNINDKRGVADEDSTSSSSSSSSIVTPHTNAMTTASSLSSLPSITATTVAAPSSLVSAPSPTQRRPSPTKYQKTTVSRINQDANSTAHITHALHDSHDHTNNSNRNSGSSNNNDDSMNHKSNTAVDMRAQLQPVLSRKIVVDDIYTVHDDRGTTNMDTTSIQLHNMSTTATTSMQAHSPTTVGGGESSTTTASSSSSSSSILPPLGFEMPFHRVNRVVTVESNNANNSHTSATTASTTPNVVTRARGNTVSDIIGRENAMKRKSLLATPHSTNPLSHAHTYAPKHANPLTRLPRSRTSSNCDEQMTTSLSEHVHPVADDAGSTGLNSADASSLSLSKKLTVIAGKSPRTVDDIQSLSPKGNSGNNTISNNNNSNNRSTTANTSGIERSGEDTHHVTTATSIIDHHSPTKTDKTESNNNSATKSTKLITRLTSFSNVVTGKNNTPNHSDSSSGNDKALRMSELRRTSHSLSSGGGFGFGLRSSELRISGGNTLLGSSKIRGGGEATLHEHASFSSSSASRVQKIRSNSNNDDDGIDHDDNNIDDDNSVEEVLNEDEIVLDYIPG